MKKTLFLSGLCLVLLAVRGFTQAPDLPSGLEEEESENEAPALPSGLEAEEEGEEEPAAEGPDLPSGLGGEEEPETETETTAEKLDLREILPFTVSGYTEGRFGLRTRNDPYQKDVSIGELRTQLDLERYIGNTRLRLVTDLVYDPVLDQPKVDLNEGQGWIDLRQANIGFTPLSFMELRIGRQIISWGTGDLLFLNDIFPKDWRAFFIGRNVNYLKAPSDSVRASFYSDMANLEIVYTPRFDPDRYIDGRRLSYWNPQRQSRAGRDHTIKTNDRDRWGKDDEIAARLHRTIEGLELAAYAYKGFWKSPAGQNPQTGKATFPPLSVYGASVRQNVFGGIGNAEIAYYHSRDDTSGTDPTVSNSEWRFLLGYEREIVSDFTVGIQYYLELMEEYNNYKATFPGPAEQARDQDRHVLTLRLTWMLMRQNLELSLFSFYSPSDQDAYFRPRATYQINDNWMIEGGGNFFTGKDSHTFFNQFNRNNNVYAALKRYF